MRLRNTTRKEFSRAEEYLEEAIQCVEEMLRHMPELIAPLEDRVANKLLKHTTTLLYELREIKWESLEKGLHGDANDD